MAETKTIPGLPGHNLKLTKQPDGKWAGRCSCGGWAGFGKSVKYVTGKWDTKHMNKFDNWT